MASKKDNVSQAEIERGVQHGTPHRRLYQELSVLAQEVAGRRGNTVARTVVRNRLAQDLIPLIHESGKKKTTA